MLQCRFKWIFLLIIAVSGCALPTGRRNISGSFNVKSFGAKGDGIALDSPAINRAIDAAGADGGGTIIFPAGAYLSTSIHLKSCITLYLDQGATIVAADSKDGYDSPEPNPLGLPNPKLDYQDFGHSHWHNSLIWGENLHDIAILGPGKIWGKGLERELLPGHGEEGGNKAIAIKLCRDVIFRDFTIEHGGWFGVLATGVDNFTIDNIKIDTNRDGIDLDCCRNVRVSNCSINSPRDDGICLKSSYALGYPRPCADITITNSQVSGYDEGTFLDGTFHRESHNKPVGRIKFGTESNGGFQNITISNCVFDYSLGLALETVDGALLEDISISNITMRDIINAPIFLRLGARMRGPAGAKIGKLRRVSISNIICYNAPANQGVLITGIPGNPIEDLSLHNIHIYYTGGGDDKARPSGVPELEKNYPEPGSFGTLPAYGFFIRHVKNLDASDIQTSFLIQDFRPPFILEDVQSACFSRIRSRRAPDVSMFDLRDVEDFTLHECAGAGDVHKDRIVREKL